MPVDPTLGTSGIHDIGVRSIVSGRPIVGASGETGPQKPISDQIQVFGGIAGELRLANSRAQEAQTTIKQVRVGMLGLDLIQAKLESAASPGSGRITDSVMSTLRRDIADIVKKDGFAGDSGFMQEDIRSLVSEREGEIPSEAYLRSLRTVDQMRTKLDGVFKEAQQALATNEVTRANLASAMNLRVAQGREEAASLVEQVRQGIGTYGAGISPNVQRSAVLKLV